MKYGKYELVLAQNLKVPLSQVFFCSIVNFDMAIVSSIY